MPMPKPPAPGLDSNQLELKADLQRKVNFLRPLITGLIVIQFIALAVSLIPPISTWHTFVILGLSLSLNLAVLLLIRCNYIQPATHLFCYTFNAAAFMTFWVNIVIDRDFEVGAAVGYILALSVLLAGALISGPATIGFAALNTVLIAIPHLVAIDTPKIAMTKSLPLMFFLWLLTIVSWLYQRTLNRAQGQLVRAKIMEHDMEIARDLQQKFYPPAPRIKKHFTIAARCEPARETGGDFYDFIELAANHEWGIVVADVTGKSLAAALVMTMTRSILRDQARRHPSPAKVLYHTNQVLLRDVSANQMITAFYGILNLHTLTLDFSNAGHIFPLLKRDGQLKDLEALGLPLKATVESDYQAKIVHLQPGDQIILTTDGVIEAMNPTREMFGFERLAQTIYQANTTDPHQTLQELWQAVVTFRGGAEQQDDMTVVVITVGDEVK